MELRHLRYFQAVAETLNFSRAAERLRVAQPALSRQIRDLETEIGVRLFDRNRVQVRLTDGGSAFLKEVNKVLQQVDAAVAAAQAATRGAAGDLVLATDWRFGMAALPHAVLTFRARYPQVEVRVEELPVHQQLTALKAGRIRLGFLPRERLAAVPDVESLLILRSEITAVLNPRHRLAGNDAIALRELAGEPWVGLDERAAPGHQAYVSQLCRPAGFQPLISRTAATVDGVLALIATGEGVAVLPRIVVERADGPLRLLPTDCSPFELCAVWRRDDDSRLLEQFVSVLREEMGGSLADMPKEPTSA